MSKLQEGIWYEDRLEGFSNYSPHNERINLFLLVNRISKFTEKGIKKQTDPKELEIYEYLDARVRLIILYGVKDSLIPHFFENNNVHEM